VIRRFRVEFADSAKSDIYDITEYVALAAGSYRTAARFVERIEDRCRRIGDAPHIGRTRDDLVFGLRTLPFEHSATIAYVIEKDLVRITNIFYGGRDFEALLRDGDAETSD